MDASMKEGLKNCVEREMQVALLPGPGQEQEDVDTHVFVLIVCIGYYCSYRFICSISKTAFLEGRVAIVRWGFRFYLSREG